MKTTHGAGRYSVLRFPSLVLLFSVLLVGLTSFQKKTPRFGDMYECYIITDVEVSAYDEDDYEQVDCEEFMNIIARAKKSHTGFAPAKEVNLYDDEGIRYRLYINKTGRFFRIDSNYFRLSPRLAKRLLHIMGQ